MSVVVINEIHNIQCDACGGFDSVFGVSINGRPLFLCQKCLSAVHNGSAFPLEAKVDKSECGRSLVTLAPFAFVGKEVFVKVPTGFASPMNELPSFIVEIMGVDSSLGPCLVLSWLYSAKTSPRGKANRVFLEACMASGASTVGVMLACAWLSVFGGESWRSWMELERKRNMKSTAMP